MADAPDANSTRPPSYQRIRSSQAQSAVRTDPDRHLRPARTFAVRKTATPAVTGQPQACAIPLCYIVDVARRNWSKSSFPLGCENGSRVASDQWKSPGRTR